MNNKSLILLSFIFFTLISCKDNSLNSNQSDCDQKIIINNSLYKNSPNDIFEFINVEIENNCIIILIEYGGGCGEVEFKLIDSEIVAKSNPPQRDIRLSFKDDDDCEALIRKEITFDLTPIQIVGTNKVYLNILNWDKGILYTY